MFKKGNLVAHKKSDFFKGVGLVEGVNNDLVTVNWANMGAGTAFGNWTMHASEIRELFIVNEGKIDLSKPQYYVDGRKYEPFDVINDWGLNFALGNVVKYISRCGRKTDDPVPDLEKARVYLDMEIARLKGEHE